MTIDRNFNTKRNDHRRWTPVPHYTLHHKVRVEGELKVEHVSSGNAPPEVVTPGMPGAQWDGFKITNSLGEEVFINLISDGTWRVMAPV